MKRRRQYIRSKANYQLRKRHMVSYDGVIFENDRFTINPEDGVYDNDSEILTFSDSNFKFKVRLEPSLQKKFNSGEWLKPNDDTEFWTAANCGSGDVTTEYRIVLNTNKTNIKNYAHFGSAVELINASIMDIILHYPGGIYELGDEAQEVELDGVTYYTLGNDFNIDVVSNGCTEENLGNPMRVLSASLNKYMFYSDKEEVGNIQVGYIGNGCANEAFARVTISSVGGSSYDVLVYKNGDGTFKLLKADGSCGDKGKPIIVPKPEVFAEMYGNLDDFSKVLLNMTTNPHFCTTLDTPFQTPTGYLYRPEKYVFPSLSYGDWFTPYLGGGSFQRYYEQLHRLGEYYDSNDTFNIWRMMTHESIKNLDWSNTTTFDGNVVSDYDMTKMKMAVTIYGRQFDELKRYIDGMKDLNRVSYSTNDGMPDYFLTDVVESGGWDAFMVNPSHDNELQTEVIYTGSSVCGHTNSEANISFMKRLALNSNYIQSMKGTRNGVETMLGLFGLKKEDNNNTGAGTYTMHEYVGIATQFPTYKEVRLANETSDDFKENEFPLIDLPVAVVNVDGEPIDASETAYVIPWYDKKNEYTKYMYFQMGGGWKHMSEKLINLGISTVSSITQNADLDIYDETVPYLKFVNTIDDLLSLTNAQLKEGMVCYVNNISDVYLNYSPTAEEQEIIDESSGTCFSNYFILKNKGLSTFLGFLSAEESDGVYNCHGWRNIFLREFDGVDGEEVTCDGAKVLYLESIKNNTTGNNPHVGFGEYDDGVGYLDYLNEIFKYKIDNKLFSKAPPIAVEGYKELGFGIDYSLLVDDKKCHYFFTDDGFSDVVYDDGIFGDDGDDIEESPVLQPIGEEDDDYNPSNWAEASSFYDNLHLSENETDVEKFDEPASFSVVNVKNLVIDFTVNGNEYLRDYIQNIVFKYLELMIPSTSILKFTFDGAESEPIPLTFSIEPQFSGVIVDADASTYENEGVMGEYDTPNEELLGIVTP